MPWGRPRPTPAFRLVLVCTQAAYSCIAGGDAEREADKVVVELEGRLLGGLGVAGQNSP